MLSTDVDCVLQAVRSSSGGWDVVATDVLSGEERALPTEGPDPALQRWLTATAAKPRCQRAVLVLEGRHVFVQVRHT